MGFEVSRTEFQTLALEKLSDATHLFENRRWSNAYYLAGYAVELALKACIAKSFKAETLPDLKFVKDTYVHALGKLVDQAGLKWDLEGAAEQVRVNWAIINKWQPEARYKAYSEDAATNILKAISDAEQGVMPWIRARW